MRGAYRKRNAPLLRGVTRFLFLSIIASLMNLGTISGGSLKDSHDGICRSESCDRFSQLIKENIDPSVDPCEDFYRYACGGWIARNPPPEDEGSWSQADISRRLIQRRIFDFLEEDVNAKRDNEAEIWVKQQYKACMNDEELNKKGIDTLLYIVDQVGDWPMIMSSTNSEESWLRIHDFYNRLTGKASLFSIRILVNGTNSNSHIVTLDQPHTMFKYSAIEDADRYINFITDVALEFARAGNPDVTRQSIMKDARLIYQFRKQLEQLRQQFPYRKIGSLVTIGELQKTTDSKVNSVQIDWLDVIKRTLQDAVPDVEIDENSAIRFREPDYVYGLLNLLKRTPRRVIINHIHFHFVERHIEYTTTSMRQILSNLRDDKSTEDRSVTCSAGPNLQRVLNRVYVKRYFPESTKAAVNMYFRQIDQLVVSLVNDIKHTLSMEILRSSWLDKNTTREALRKLENVATIIGHDDWYENDEKTIEYYKQYNAGADYLHNILKHEGVKYRSELKLLQQVVPDVRKISQISPASFDAVYRIITNKLEIPAAYLQWPIFNDTLPNVVNYATIGSLVGNKFSHAFDFYGRQIGPDGNFGMGWSAIAIAEYDERTRCFIDQYSRNTGKEIDQESMKSEFSGGMIRLYVDTVPDAEGLIVGYETYVRKLKEKTRRARQTLPRLDNFNNDKIFFLSYASRYCHSFDPSTLSTIKEEDIPITPRLVVNTAVSNMRKFSNVFKCKANAPMNPKNKCKVWG